MAAAAGADDITLIFVVTAVVSPSAKSRSKFGGVSSYSCTTDVFAGLRLDTSPSDVRAQQCPVGTIRGHQPSALGAGCVQYKVEC